MNSTNTTAITTLTQITIQKGHTSWTEASCIVFLFLEKLVCKDCNSSNKYNVPSNKPYLCHLQDIPPVSLTASNTTASWFVIAPALTHQHATAQEFQRQDQKAPTKESSLRTRRQSRDTLIWGAATADNKTEKSKDRRASRRRVVDEDRRKASCLLNLGSGLIKVDYKILLPHT